MPASQSAPYDSAAPADAERLQWALRSVDALPRRRDQLLPALLVAQHALGWLPRAAIEHAATHIHVPVSEVYATATGYSELLLERPTPGTWHVCTGVSCDLAGGRALLDAVSEALPGRAQAIDCQFLCALAPVAVDDAERLHGRVTPSRILDAATERAAP